MMEPGRAAERPRWGIVAVHCFLLIGILFAALVNATVGYQPGSLIYPTCVTLLCLFAWSLLSWRMATGSLFDPYALFLIAAFLFNAGQAFLEVFHLNELGILRGIFAPGIVLESLFLVLIGLGAMHLGALLAVALVGSDFLGRNAAMSAPMGLFDDLRLAGWILFLVSAFPAVLELRDALAVVLSAGYAALYQRHLVTGLSNTRDILAGFVAAAAFFILVGGRRSRLARIVSAVTILSYSFIQLFLGARAAGFLPLLMYAWLWDRYIRRIPRSVLTAGAALMLLVFPLIAVTRNVSGSQRLSFDFLTQAFSTVNNPFVATVSEMGNSIEAVAYTLILVPTYRGFDFGVGYLYAASSIIPNLFWSVHPATAHGTYSDWLVQTVDPATALSRGGLGFSFIAEAYANFGQIGTPIFLAVLGFFLARFVLWGLHSIDPARAAALAAYFVLLVPYVRGEALYVFRPFVWYSLAPYGLVLAVRMFRRRSAARARARDAVASTSGARSSAAMTADT